MSRHKTHLVGKVLSVREVHLEEDLELDLMVFRTSLNKDKEEAKVSKGKAHLVIYLTNLRKCLEDKVEKNEGHLIK